MIYKSKSILVCRRKDKKHEQSEQPYPIEIKLFDINDPQKTSEVPKETLEFFNIHKIIFMSCPVEYLPLGSDILINDIISFDLIESGGHLEIKKIK